MGKGISCIFVSQKRTEHELLHCLEGFRSTQVSVPFELILIGVFSHDLVLEIQEHYAQRLMVRLIPQYRNKPDQAILSLAASKARQAHLFFGHPSVRNQADLAAAAVQLLDNAGIGGLCITSDPSSSGQRTETDTECPHPVLFACRRADLMRLGGMEKKQVQDAHLYLDLCRRLDDQGLACLSLRQEGLALDTLCPSAVGTEEVQKAGISLLHTEHQAFCARILWLLNGPGGSGGALSVVQEAHCMLHMGWDSRVAIHIRHKEQALRTYRHFSPEVFFFYGHLEELKSKAQSFDFGVATHFSTMDTLVELCRACAHLRPAYYIQDYEPWIVNPQAAKYKQQLQKAAESYTRLPQTVCFAKTDWLKQTVEQHQPVTVQRVQPGLDTRVFVPNMEAVNRHPQGRVQVVAMVRFQTPRRSPHKTLSILQRIKERLGEQVEIVVFGCPEDHAELTPWKEAFDFHSKGVLTTPLVAKLFSKADIFLDASVYQAFGRTGLEAMACGCAAILPARGGVHAYAVHRRNCLLVDTDDLQACVQAVTEVINDQVLRITLAENGVRTAAAHSLSTAALSEMLVFKKALLKGDPVSEAANTAEENREDENSEDRTKGQHLVQGLKRRLYEQGFVARAKSELSVLAADFLHPFRQKPAAWELAVWHANQNTPDNAKTCLEYLQSVRGHEAELPRLSQVAVLRSECCSLLGRDHEGLSTLRLAMQSLKIRQQLLGPASEDHPDEGTLGTKTRSQDQKSMDIANLCLAAANLQTSFPAWLESVNQAFNVLGVAPLTYPRAENECTYDCLGSLQLQRREQIVPNVDEQELVSVIVPVYNGENTLHTALDSLLDQTWSSLEILVVDDCSTDRTAQIISEYTRRDSRVCFLQTARNQGPYVARNVALQQAAGTLVTCHDADDWSHPDKIAFQAGWLQANKDVVANISGWARLKNDLTFYRRGNPGFYIQLNISSLMFRRQPVMEQIGFWDSVRFGADTEMYYRLRRVFGPEQVAEQSHALLSFSRTTGHSLTESVKFGYPGFLMGARKEYKESYAYFHAQSGSFYYPFPLQERPFPVPQIMQPEKEQGAKHWSRDGNLHTGFLDVVFVADFSLPDNARRLFEALGYSWSEPSQGSADETGAPQESAPVGLVQVYAYTPDVNPTLNVHPKVRNLIHTGRARMIVYGEAAGCEKLVFLDPRVKDNTQLYVPEIETHSGGIGTKHPESN